MKRKVRRRRYNTYRSDNLKKSIITITVLVCFSVFAGYVTATRIIGPVLGLEPQITLSDFVGKQNGETEEDSSMANKDDKTDNTDKTDIISDQLNTESGFALQYGSFSEKAGAEECANDLEESGIDVQIVEKDGAYKVISRLFDTEEDARSYMEEEPEITKDAFITEISN